MGNVYDKDNKERARKILDYHKESKKQKMDLISETQQQYLPYKDVF